MTADQDNNAALNGVGQNPDGTPNQTALNWRWVWTRGRQIPAALHRAVPFNWPIRTKPASTSIFDVITAGMEQTASRWIDPYGNVINFMDVWVCQWLWFLDGCPSPLSQTRLAQYRKLSNQLNPWPNNYPGMNKTFAAEQFADYPAWPPTTPVPLDTFLK
jgi:hypothetical protein